LDTLLKILDKKIKNTNTLWFKSSGRWFLNISGFLESIKVLLYRFSMSILKKLSILFFTLFFASCTLNKIDNVHGVSNLKNKIKLIKINETNKNDITKILGPVPIENKEEKRWTYFEVRETKTKYGKRDIYVNDYVEIFFNNYGIANKIEFYDLSNMKNIKFAKEKTKSLGVKDTFSKNLLSSTRKRMENARKKFEK